MLYIQFNLKAKKFLSSPVHINEKKLWTEAYKNLRRDILAKSLGFHQSKDKLKVT